MRRFRSINLISFCALVLFAADNSVTEGYGLRNYFQTMLDSLKSLNSVRHGILPGTLWCGSGNLAYNDSELGSRRELDTCCRAHDRCDDYIRSKSSKYGLYNKYVCRSSLCECDLQFYDCLTGVRGFVATAVGNIYFTKCKQCFRTYYDAETCIREGLDVNEGVDRQGRRVFCAKFDRNPKWGQRRNGIPSSESIPTFELSTRNDNEPEQSVLRSYSINDSKYFDDVEDDDTSIGDN